VENLTPTAVFVHLMGKRPSSGALETPTNQKKRTRREWKEDIEEKKEQEEMKERKKGKKNEKAITEEGKSKEASRIRISHFVKSLPEAVLSLTVRLDASTAGVAAVTNPEVLRISRPEWITSIESQTSYLFDVVARVLDCNSEAVKLHRRKDGRDAADDSSDWIAVHRRENILGGVYLCNVPKGMFILYSD
jgi:hypothetical protein